MSGTFIVIPPVGKERSIRHEKKKTPNLDIPQKECEGYVERVKVRYEGKLRDAFVDEDGYAHRRLLNIRATRLLTPAYGGTTIVGTMVVWVPDPPASKPALTQRETSHE
jgi:hypothetical protein